MTKSLILSKQLNDKTYFVSPLRTLYQSLKNPASVSSSDIIEAYITFNNRVRGVVKWLNDSSDPLPPALLTLQEYSPALGKSLRRDLELSSFEDESVIALHEYAVRITSGIFKFSWLYRIMHAYASKLLSRLYGIVGASWLPPPALRIQDIAWLVLRGLDIPYEDLFVQKTTRTIYTACCDVLSFVPGEPSTYRVPFAVDGLEAVNNILVRYPQAFHLYTEEAIKIFGKVCMHLFHKNLDIRANAMRTLCAFSRAKLLGRPSPSDAVCNMMSQVLSKAITRWAWYDPPSPPSTPEEITQTKQLTSDDFHQLFSIPASAFSATREGPQYERNTVISLMVALITLIDCPLFLQSNRRRCRTFFKKSLEFIHQSSVPHSQQLVKVVWCAQLWVWSRCRPNESEIAAFAAESACVTSQGFAGYVRPMAGTLLGWEGFEPSTIENGLQIFFDIMSRLLKSQNLAVFREAAEVFCWVISTIAPNQPKVTKPPTPSDPLTSFVLHLLDSSFCNHPSDITSTNLTLPFSTESIRQLSEDEVDTYWARSLELWCICVEGWVQISDDTLEDKLLEAWRVLYLARSQVIVENQEHRHTAPAPSLGILVSALEQLLQPNGGSLNAQIRKLRLAKRAWHSLQTTFSHAPHRSLCEPTTLLSCLLRQAYAIDDIPTRTALSAFIRVLLVDIECLSQESTALFERGIPAEDTLEEFQHRTLWVLEVYQMSQTQSLNGKSWDNAISFLSQPFAQNAFTPDLNEDEVQYFRQALSRVFWEAKAVGEASKAVDIFLLSMGPSALMKVDPLKSILLLLIEYELDAIPFLRWTADRIKTAYQNGNNSAISTLFQVVALALQKFPTSMVLVALSILERGLKLFISDCGNRLSPDQHQQYTLPLYTAILTGLGRLSPSRDMLIRSTSLLIAPFDRLGVEAEAQAFYQFWTSKFHEHRLELRRYVNENLRSVLLACQQKGYDFYSGLESQDTEDEKSGSVIPDSHPQPEETSHERAERAHWGLPEDTKGFHGLSRRTSIPAKAHPDQLVSVEEDSFFSPGQTHSACGSPITTPTPKTSKRGYPNDYDNDSTPCASTCTRKRPFLSTYSQRKRRRKGDVQSSPLLPAIELLDRNMDCSRSQSAPVLQSQAVVASHPLHEQELDHESFYTRDTSTTTTPNAVEDAQEDYDNWEVPVVPNIVRSLSDNCSDSGIPIDHEDGGESEDEHMDIDILSVVSKEISTPLQRPLAVPRSAGIAPHHVPSYSTEAISLEPSQCRRNRIELLDAAHAAIFSHGGTQEESMEELLRQQTLAIGIARGCQERMERKVASMHSRPSPSPLL